MKKRNTAKNVAKSSRFTLGSVKIVCPRLTWMSSLGVILKRLKNKFKARCAADETEIYHLVQVVILVGTICVSLACAQLGLDVLAVSGGR